MPIFEHVERGLIWHDFLTFSEGLHDKWVECVGG